MWQAMSSSTPPVFTISNAQGIERVKESDGQYAYIMDSASLEWTVEKDCNLIKVGETFSSKGYGVVLQPGSPYK